MPNVIRNEFEFAVINDGYVWGLTSVLQKQITRILDPKLVTINANYTQLIRLINRGTCATDDFYADANS